MEALNNVKLRIMVRAFRIRIAHGESFEEIAAACEELMKCL